MAMNNEIKDRASDASCLEGRIAQNAGYQKTDLVEWIFERVKVDRGSRVLELCCGTGNQSIKLIELIGAEGHLTALDISEEALEKLRARLDEDGLQRVSTIAGSMDDLPELLQRHGLKDEKYDLILCAYGLYYSERVDRLLMELTKRLSANGRIVVVGPFGPNNGPLFGLLEDAGVEIPEYVMYTSRDFMETKVLPFANRNFQTSHVNVLVNPISWTSKEDVYEYWRNTTFFDEAKSDFVIESLNKIYEKKTIFMNEKWVMMVELNKKRN